MSQWADTHKINCGLGRVVPNSRPKVCQLRRNSLSSIAFIGLPWPKNITGMRGVLGRDMKPVSPLEFISMIVYNPVWEFALAENRLI